VTSGRVKGGGGFRLLRLAWRESRAARRRLLLYMSSISLGVAALVAIDSFAANVTRSVREQSRNLLGGDIAFTARDRFSDSALAVFDSLRAAGTAMARVTSFPSMASVPRSGGTRLSEVRAVSSEYPLYGTVVTDPPDRWRTLNDSAIAFVDPALLIGLGARVGDTVTLGFARFVIGGTIQAIPGDPGVAAIIGPRVFIADRWLSATRLLTTGSRAEYQSLVKLPEGTAPGRWVAPLRRRLDGQGIRIRTVRQSENNLTSTVAQLSEFLSVVGLIALLLGGIGVASGVHAFVQRKIDTVAILRCLGATGWQVLAVYVVQAAAMGLVGAAFGAILGVAIQFAAPHFIGEFLPVDVSVTVEPRAVLTGLAIGGWVALVFALRPLLILRRVSPLATLRRDTESLGIAQRRDLLGWGVTLALVLSVVALAYGRAEEVMHGTVYVAGIAASLGVLAFSAWTLTTLARRLTRARWPFVVRQGVANLHRPSNQTRAVVLALGFGAFLVTTLYLVQGNLLRAFDVSAEASQGNVLFFDVQDDQRTGLDSLIRAEGHTLVQSVPIVTMRISRINGDNTADYARGVGLPRTHWALRREYRSTYRDTTVRTEQVVAGTWFGGTGTAAIGTVPADSIFDVSLDNDLATELHVSLGDEITWDVQGVPVRTRITSMRDVNWGRFEPNFFAVFPPAALRGAPQQHVIVAAVSSDSAIARLQRETVVRYPNIASIDLSLVRSTILRIVDRASSAVQFLALFSFAMGVPVLFSSVAATRRDRLHEGVLLKALGATRRQIGRILLSEYAALGLLGSLTGMFLSFAGAWGLMHFVFHLTFRPAVIPAAVIAAVMTAMALAIGVSTSREVFRVTAMEALRDQ
jgi:putative ABC transport system permease protein